MNQAQSAILPAAMLGCVIVVILGVVLSSQMRVPAAMLSAQAALQKTNVAAANPQPASDSPASQEKQAGVDSKPVEQPIECQVSQRFPESVRQWCTLITTYAQKNDLDPNLVASVMLQESGGDPEALSKSGAVGLLQVMPRDGVAAQFQCINGPCFSARPSMAELKDPEFNLSYGTRMLAGLIQKHGDVREALRYYGPKDVGYAYADIVLSILQNYE